MKVARMHVTPELLADFLELPDGSNVVGARFFERDGESLVELVVEHPDFDEVDPDAAPIVEPVYSRPTADTPATFASWGKR